MTVDIEQLREAWPRLAEGLFDLLADIDAPRQTLADLDVVISAARLVADGVLIRREDIDYEAAAKEAKAWVQGVLNDAAVKHMVREIVDAALHPPTEGEA